MPYVEGLFWLLLTGDVPGNKEINDILFKYVNLLYTVVPPILKEQEKAKIHGQMSMLSQVLFNGITVLPNTTFTQFSLVLDGQ